MVVAHKLMQILLTIAYDGTGYCGWQRQENGLAVQQALEEALAVLLQRNVLTTASSRTDAGVHALGQRATFDGTGLKIPVQKLPQVLNGLLPGDISVMAEQNVADDFNPRFHARRKTYTYRFHQADVANPLLNRYSLHVPRALDIHAMQKTAQHFIGRHDFASFCATGGSAKTTVREMYACDVAFLPVAMGTGDAVTFTVTGNGFLYNMVRIMAGTVLYAGLGKISPGDIPRIITACDRTQAGKTLPPHGLTLVDVAFD